MGQNCCTAPLLEKKKEMTKMTIATRDIEQEKQPEELRKIKGLCDYTSRTTNDVEFRKGDILNVINDDDDDWWIVEHTLTKKQGYVPRNHVACLDRLESYDWFMGFMSKKVARENLMVEENGEGTFLIRDMESNPGVLTLSMKVYSEEIQQMTCKHHGIIYMHDNMGYYFTPREKFPTLPALVKHYSETADFLCHKLVSACPRPRPEMLDLSKDTKDSPEIPIQSLKLTRELASGPEAEVFEGTWNAKTKVAIKVLGHCCYDRGRFLTDIQLLKQFRHNHLVSLYAVCTACAPTVYIVTEFMTNGCLLDYLGNKENNITFPNMVDMAAEIANCMAYLEERNFIHKTLAARNILMRDDYHVKVADFGLADFEEKESYTVRLQGNIKWTAPEAAEGNKFSVKSDVWSYGIVLFEIVTRGANPYHGMTDPEVLSEVTRGYRMPKPRNLPVSMYDCMRQCWSKKPGRRPTFRYLHKFFEDDYPYTDDEFNMTADFG